MTTQRRQFTLLFASIFFLKLSTEVSSSQESVQSTRKRAILAFAAGFGSSKPPTPNKKSKGRRKRGGLATEVQTPKESEESELSKDDAPILDKWGLPIPTEDDIFPPLPTSTRLVSMKEDEPVTLKDIEMALRDHLLLDLHRFIEDGVEKSPSPDTRPMKLRLLHRDPPVLSIDDFFTDDECEKAKAATTNGMEIGSKTFSPLATSKRTSTSWFCHYSDMATLLAKANHMLGIPITQMEEPQVVRYRTGEEFTWHYDEVPPTQLDNGGQRLATLLVYLNTVSQGGGTIFRDLKAPDGSTLTMKPKRGSALLFFPAFRDGNVDDRTLHKGESAQDEKWITQMWIHKEPYTAVVPPGNSHEAAQSVVDKVSAKLGHL